MSRPFRLSSARSLFAALALLTPLAAQSQAAHGQAAPEKLTPAELRGAGDTSIFAPLGLQPGNEYRSGSGAPGPRYWQQRADYVLRGTLDTAAKSLKGEETIRYVNHSPDTLHFVWLQVEQNAFRDGSMNSYVFPATSRFGARNFEGGDVIDHLDQLSGKTKKALASRVEGTMMKVDLSSPLAPGASTTLSSASRPSRKAAVLPTARYRRSRP